MWRTGGFWRRSSETLLIGSDFFLIRNFILYFEGDSLSGEGLDEDLNDERKVGGSCCQRILKMVSQVQKLNVLYI